MPEPQAESYTVTTLAGLKGNYGLAKNGKGETAGFTSMKDHIVADTQGNLYVADGPIPVKYRLINAKNNFHCNDYITAHKFFYKRKHKTVVNENRISITGSTRNISGYAAVVADCSDVYYVEGMNEWSDSWLNHTVKIIGDLGLPGYEMRKINEEGRSENTQKIIRAAVVMLLDGGQGCGY